MYIISNISFIYINNKDIGVYDILLFSFFSILYIFIYCNWKILLIYFYKCLKVFKKRCLWIIIKNDMTLYTHCDIGFLCTRSYFSYLIFCYVYSKQTQKNGMHICYFSKVKYYVKVVLWLCVNRTHNVAYIYTTSNIYLIKPLTKMYNQIFTKICEINCRRFHYINDF